MLRTSFWYLFGWLYLVITLPLLWRAGYLEKHRRNQECNILADRFTKSMCRYLFRLTGSTVKVTGRENLPKDGPVLFVSNHQSHIDSTIIHGFIDVPLAFISIVEVKKIPILSTWMEYMRCVFLDRADIRQTFACIEESVELLKQGHSMVIYPEGKLSEGETVGEFKKGSLKLAVKAGVPIVPITLKGTHKVMTKDGSRIRPAAVECIISKPIATADLGKVEEKKLVDTVREIITQNI